MTLLLILLYPFAVQYERGGVWRILAPVTLLALLIDVWCNYTELAVLTWDRPKQGEHTFSTRCKRLCSAAGWRGYVGRVTSAYCNFWAPNHAHI